MSGKRYNKEVKKQLTMSLISDELGQASTKKKEFLGIMEKLIPWSEWVGIVQPHYSITKESAAISPTTWN